MYHTDAKSFAKKLMNEIVHKTRIPSTVGIGTNLYLAKIALDITAKKSKDHMGYLNEELYRETLWDHRPITDFWQIARGTAARLQRFGINTMRGIATFPEDMHKLTIRTSTSKPYVDTLGALGAVTVPLALTELFTSLQMGVVDASEGPMDQIVGYKLYEVQDHIALSGHAYSLSCWIMNSDFYQGLDPAYQEIIDAATAEACEFGTKLGEEREAALIEECKSYGVAFNEVDLLPFIEKARPAIDALFAADWPVTNADEVASYAN